VVVVLEGIARATVNDRHLKKHISCKKGLRGRSGVTPRRTHLQRFG